MLKKMLLPLLILVAIALFFVGDRWSIPTWVPIAILLVTCPIAMSSMHGHGAHGSEHDKRADGKRGKIEKNS